MGSNGENQIQLGAGAFPDWSPDGKIAFVSNRGDTWDIWTMVPISK